MFAVTGIGGGLGQGAIVAREYGLAGVMATNSATRRSRKGIG